MTPEEKGREADHASDHELRKTLWQQTSEDLRRLEILERQAELVIRGRKP